MKLTRRLFVSTVLIAAPALLFSGAAVPQRRTPNKPYLVYVGTYTNKSASKGIYVYSFDPGTGKLSSLGDAADFVQHHGSSVNKERQEGPHAHWIGTSPDNRFALVADLGLDEVLIYRFNSAKGTLSPHDPPYAKVSPGAGPRHIAFHPNGKFAYALTEMEESVTAFAYKASNGSFSPLQTVSALSTLRKDYKGPKEAAEIAVHPNGKFLYASNRGGIDTISAFSIDPAKGTLHLKDEYPTMGKTPRNFAIDPTGKFLLAANQESNNIVTFRIDAITGALSPTGDVVEAPAPVCIVFVSVR